MRAFLAAPLLTLVAGIAGGEPDDRGVNLVAETSLAFRGKNTVGNALDGDTKTLFETRRPPGPDDDFTLTFSRPVEASRILAITGKADGTGRVLHGVLETSGDAETFEKSAPFEGGLARLDPGEPVRAIRIRFTGAQDSRLALREIVVDSTEPIGKAEVVPRFRVDTTEIPELEEWGQKAKALCERWYPIIVRMFAGDDTTPPNVVDLVFKGKMNGVAFASGPKITISGPFVLKNPDDFGMVVHELTHVIQNYRDTDAGWLVEGIADYVRIVHFEPEARRPRINPDKASYRDAYKTTAAFLEYVEKKYDDQLVKTLNRSLREGTYDDKAFEKLTGHSLDDLWAEFTDTLRKPKADDAP